MGECGKSPFHKIALSSPTSPPPENISNVKKPWNRVHSFILNEWNTLNYDFHLIMCFEQWRHQYRDLTLGGKRGAILSHGENVHDIRVFHPFEIFCGGKALLWAGEFSPSPSRVICSILYIKKRCRKSHRKLDFKKKFFIKIPEDFGEILELWSDYKNDYCIWDSYICHF